MSKRKRTHKRMQKRSEPAKYAVSNQTLFQVLAVIALPFVIYGGWRVWRNNANSSQVATTANSTDSTDLIAEPDGVAAAVRSQHPDVNHNDNQLIATNPEIAPAPGAQQRSFVAPLADAYRRIDPNADGWETEAFHDATSQQLDQLTRLFKEDEPDRDAKLTDWVAVDFQQATLRPAQLQEVFQDEALRVLRADSLDGMDNSVAVDVANVGPQKLLSAVDQFREFYHSGQIERIKLKPFKVEFDQHHPQTRMYFQSFGPTSNGTLQVNAEWILGWSLGVDQIPKLRSIQLAQFEAVEHSDSAQRMFSDCTEAVLGDTDAYRQQFSRSTDYWRSRLPRDLGLDVVANHGVALGDVNGDLLDDIYVCQQGGLPNRLLIQNADGTLRDATAQSGADWLDYCASALLVDFDNDGDRDLIVAQEWRILIMSNDGQGRFQLEFGTSTEAQTFSVAAADFDLDGDLDVYVCGYNPTASTLRRGVMGEPVPYHDANNGGRNLLLRNDGNWLFTDATSDVGLDQNNSRFSFAASWEDYDNDGDPDLYVANDYGRNNLYQNNDGAFVDVAPELGVEDMSAGMSASWADFNHDGWMDLYVSNMFSAAGNRITYQRQFKTETNAQIREQFQRHARGNTLFVNSADGFRDISEQAGVTMGRWAWGSRFADLNSDGWDDLVVANGFISTDDTGDL